MKNKEEERRKFTRYSAEEDSLIFCHKRAGRVLNISEGGMEIDIIDNSGPLPDECQTTFYCISTETKIDDLSLKLVHAKDKKMSKFGINYQKVGVKFDRINALQQEQIKEHISGLF